MATAKSKKVVFPAIRLTKRPTGGKKKVEYLYRGAPADTTTTLPAEQTSVLSLSDLGETICPPPIFTEPATCENEPTTFSIESRSSVVGWEKVRVALRNAVMEAAAMPLHQACLLCNEEASLRCKQCGPICSYCTSCFSEAHSSMNIFHVAEKWENGHFVPFVRENVRVDIRPNHVCDTKKEGKIMCIDSSGVEHSMLFVYCTCEALAVTLARAELWPATPVNPQYAFSFDLLDWAEALLLEAQVSLKDFYKSLELKCKIRINKKRDVYSALINSFEEFKYLRHQLRNMKFVCSDLNSGNICPACPQRGGTVVLSMDALFGLPRKKSAGMSHREPLLKDVFFEDQSLVDQFLVDNREVKSHSNTCSNFLAGNAIRSARRFKALDETAVFGYCCRHEFPGRFISLKHGERLAYSIYVLEKILDGMQSKQISEVYVTYDIACTLTSHLRKRGRIDILDKIHLCLPTFHCYGHKLSCQILYGPRRCEGIGLSDGEGMERMWSYLRGFNRMTKEMRPSHRIDVLSVALEYYSIRTKKKIASLLLSRWDRTMKTKVLAEEKLHDLMPSYSLENTAIIEKWLKDEVTFFSNDSNSVLSALPQWKIFYFQNLHIYYSLRCQMLSGNSNKPNVERLSQLDEMISEIEKKHQFERWQPSHEDYKTCERFLLGSEKEKLLLQLWQGSQRRHFLLKLKAKYADGQKIAKRLGSQISKETRDVQRVLGEYNTILESRVDAIPVADALDPSKLMSRLQLLGVQATTGGNELDERREITQAYLTYKRSLEETTLLKEDIKNVVAYYEEVKSTALGEIDRLDLQIDSCSRGTKALLYNFLADVEQSLQDGRIAMESIYNSSPLSPAILDDSSSDSDVSDCD